MLRTSAIIGFTFKSGMKQTWLQTDGEFILGQKSTMDLSSFTQSPLLCVKCLDPYTEYNYSIVIHKKNMTKTPAKPFFEGSHNCSMHPDRRQDCYITQTQIKSKITSKERSMHG